MSKLELSITDTQELMPPCLEPLLRYGGPFYNEKYHLPHPDAMVRLAWILLVDSINNFIDALEKARERPRFQSAPMPDSQRNLLDALAKYQTVIYQATEFIETLTGDNLKRCLLPVDRFSEWKPSIKKAWRNHPTIICNQIKHEHNLLVHIEGEYQYGTVEGYAVCRYENGVLKPNPIIHSKLEAFAYGSDLRLILANIYLICNAIGEQINQLSKDFPEKDVPKGSVQYSQQIEFLAKVSQLMPMTFPDQTREKTAIFNFNGTTLSICETGGTPLSVGQIQVASTYRGDGHTRSFHLFYGKKE